MEGPCEKWKVCRRLEMSQLGQKRKLSDGDDGHNENKCIKLSNDDNDNDDDDDDDDDDLTFVSPFRLHF